jgi:hypothetical protein
MNVFQSECSRAFLSVLQIFTGALTILASLYRWEAWWVVTVPWAILNLPGILLAIPLVAAAFVAAGVAHFDWRSGWFFAGCFIVAPTILSVIFCHVWMMWRRRQADAVRPAGVMRRRRSGPY